MKHKVLWASSVIVVLGAAGFGVQVWNKEGKEKQEVEEVRVVRGTLDVKILSTGVVEPENRLEIKAPVAGRADQILVDEGARVKKGDILAWLSSTERAALLDAASAKGPEEVRKWEGLYRPTPILAPISGTIIQRKVESGQTFTTQDAILVMSDRLTVRAQVDETDIAQIKVKQPASIVLDAYSGQEIDGTVVQIAFDAKTVNNVTTYVVDVLPTSVPEFMRSGMTANVTFRVSSKSDALIIPVSGVSYAEGKSIVRVPGKTSRQPAESREVQPGLTDGKRMEVLSGLAEGDVILVPKFQLEGRKESGNPFSPMGRGRGRAH